MLTHFLMIVMGGGGGGKHSRGGTYSRIYDNDF